MTLSDSERAKVRDWLSEDIGSGDVTTRVLLPDLARAKAVATANERLVVCGLPWVEECFLALDPHAKFEAKVRDGAWIDAGRQIFSIEGSYPAILSAERTALNILQRLSGIATLTRMYVEQVDGTRTRILDTRKTTPGLRAEEKYATRVGGAENYRMGLFDLPMIKDNHLAGIGLRDAIRRFAGRFDLFVVEVEDLDQLKIALDEGAPWIMLDNFSLHDIREAARLCSGRARLEVSGGVSLDGVRAIAECGVDYISVGAITHSARSVDISLEVIETSGA